LQKQRKANFVIKTKMGGAINAPPFLYDPKQSGDEAGFIIKALAGRQNTRPNQPPDNRKECAELRNKQ
jgi:hypothetical protein